MSNKKTSPSYSQILPSSWIRPQSDGDVALSPSLRQREHDSGPSIACIEGMKDVVWAPNRAAIHSDDDIAEAEAAPLDGEATQTRVRSR